LRAAAVEVRAVERVLAILATLSVGALVAFQPPINSQLAKHSTVLSAAFISTAVSALFLGVLVVVAQDLEIPRGVPLIYLTGGLIGAALITVSLVTVRTLGAGGVVAATISTQVIVSAVLDRLGVLGLDETPLTTQRLVGFGLLLAGTALVTLD
jgi:transporter family-2 protein